MKLASGIATVIVAVATAASAQAGSVAGFGGATEITQILNNAELVTQSGQMYQQVQQTIQQVAYEKQQLQNLIAAPAMEWGQAQAQLQALKQSVTKGQALGYSLGNIDQQFSNKYPGYNSGNGGRKYQDASKSWIATTLDSVRGALTAAGLRTDQFGNEQTAMNNIQNVASTAPGQLQVAQAGVMMAGQQVQQLQKLSQLYAAQMQAQGAYMSQQADQQAFDQQSSTSHFQPYQSSSTPKWSSGGGLK